MRERVLAPLAFAAMVVFLGVNFVAVRISNRELDPFWGGAFRFVLASALLCGVALAMRIPWPKGRALAGAALFGALAFGGNFALLYWALQRAPAALASVLYATVPLLTLLGAAMAGQESLRARALLGALIAGVGAASLFAAQLRADVPLAAVIAILGGAVCAAAAGIVVKGFPKSHPVASNAVGMAVGAAMLFVISWPAGDLYYLPRAGETWGAVAWLVASSTISFVLMVWLIGQWGPSRVSYGSVLSPLVTALVALWLTGEPITAALVLGGALVLVGVWVGALSKPKPAPSPNEAAARG